MCLPLSGPRQLLGLHTVASTPFSLEADLKGLLHAQVPISTNPILPTPGESGLLLETVQIRITIDPEPRNVKRAMEVRWQSVAL